MMGLLTMPMTHEPTYHPIPTLAVAAEEEKEEKILLHEKDS